MALKVSKNLPQHWRKKWKITDSVIWRTVNTHGLLVTLYSDSRSRHPAFLCCDAGLSTPTGNPVPPCTQYKSMKTIQGIAAATYQNPVVKGRVGVALVGTLVILVSYLILSQKPVRDMSAAEKVINGHAPCIRSIFVYFRGILFFPRHVQPFFFSACECLFNYSL